jgi:hypothetical protein
MSTTLLGDRLKVSANFESLGPEPGLSVLLGGLHNCVGSFVGSTRRHGAPWAELSTNKVMVLAVHIFVDIHRFLFVKHILELG